MTSLRTRPRLLGAAERGLFESLVREEPVTNCVIDALVARARSLSLREIGGSVWAVDDQMTGRLAAATYVGGNVIPIGRDRDALVDIAAELRRAPRACSSIVGPAESVSALWPMLSSVWGPARAMRACQPFLVTSREPAARSIASVASVASVRSGSRVRRVASSELGAYEQAAVEMFREELGVRPSSVDGGAAYRRRLIELVRAGRVFACFDARGAVEFKAEVGALSPSAAQIQGVWVRPDLRGQGLATQAMTSVVEHALQLAPTVCLYVNDYNQPARRLYERVGFCQVDTFTTVLF